METRSRRTRSTRSNRGNDNSRSNRSNLNNRTSRSSNSGNTRSNSNNGSNQKFNFYKQWWFWLLIIILIALLAQCNRQRHPSLFVELNKDEVRLDKNFNAKITFQTNKNNKYYVNDINKNQAVTHGTVKGTQKTITLHQSGKFQLTVSKNNQSKSVEFKINPLQVSQSAINASMNDHGDTALDKAPNVDLKNIPKNYKSAYKAAEKFSNQMHMSKAGIYSHLTSGYGTNYSTAAAQFAVDNLNADYDNNALQMAKNFKENYHMSDDSIRDRLTSKSGEQFTDSQADYAMNHLDK